MWSTRWAPSCLIAFIVGLSCLEIPVAHATDHSGIIDTNTTWTASGNPHRIIDWLYIENGATLDVQPGVQIEFVGSYASLVATSGSLEIDDATITGTANYQMISFGQSASGWIRNSDLSYLRISVDINNATPVFSGNTFDPSMSHIYLMGNLDQTNRTLTPSDLPYRWEGGYIDGRVLTQTANTSVQVAYADIFNSGGWIVEPGADLGLWYESAAINVNDGFLQVDDATITGTANYQMISFGQSASGWVRDTIVDSAEILVGGPGIDLSNDIFNRGTIGINYTGSGTLTVSSSDFLSHSSYGAWNSGPGLIDARGCYWGSPDGPSGVGPGSGDAVSAGVLYDPWETGPINFEPVQAAFTWAPNSPSIDQPVQFTDVSTREPSSWQWDFGDGSPLSSIQNPSHTYVSTGNFTVTLAVENRFGADSVSHTVSVSSSGTGSDGTLKSWGRNNWGQLGDSSFNDSPYPIDVVDLSNVVAVSCGAGHSLALKNDGTVWAWGYNRSGQLGDGTNVNRPAPVQVAGLSNVTKISAGASHNLAIKGDGTLWAWGDNGYGQLGDSTNIRRYLPVQIGVLSNVIAISAGEGHSIAVTADGTAWSWGRNDRGQLGDGTKTTRNFPAPVVGISNVEKVAAGWLHSLALLGEGTVWAWGYGNAGALGQGVYASSDTPVQTINLSGVVEISCGNLHSLALRDDKSIWSWGANGDGQLGIDSNVNQKTPVEVSGSISADTIAVGAYHNLVVADDGTVWAWGRNGDGQVGDNSHAERPAPIQALYVENAAHVSGGYYHSLISVDLSEPPVADFAWTPPDPAVDQPIKFTDFSTGGPSSWLWDFGDGSATSTEQHPTHAYVMPGTYTVTLTVTNNFGSDIATDSIFLASDCWYSLDQPAAAFPSLGGTGSFSVSAGAGCSWTAVESNPWITVIFGTAGIGAGTVVYVVEGNTGSARLGTIQVVGQTHTVLQNSASSGLQLDSLEVTQGTQDLENNVSLVEGRRTFVRAHVKSLGGTLSRVRGSLAGYRGETPLGVIGISNRVMSNGDAINVDAVDVKSQPNPTLPGEYFLFELPYSWLQDTLELQFLAEGYNPHCPTLTNCRLEVSFEPGVEPELRFIGVSWNDGQWHTPTHKDIENAASELYSTMPVRSLTYSYHRIIRYNSGSAPDTDDEFKKIYRRIEDIKVLDQSNAYYVGVLIDSPNSGLLGIAKRSDLLSDSYVAAGYIGGNRTLSHEFGHVLGRKHTKYSGKECGDWYDLGLYCGHHCPGDGTIGSLDCAPYSAGTVYGFNGHAFDENLLYVVVKPSRTPDLMSYGDGRWPSPYTLGKMRETLVSRHGSDPLKKLSTRKLEEEGSLGVLVTGLIDPDSLIGNLNPLVIVNSPAPGVIPEPGSAVLRFEDENGAIIAEYSFEPSPLAEVSELAFGYVLPWDGETARVVLLYEGTEMAEAIASESPPTVDVDFPNGGEILDGEIETLVWSASDDDGDNLSFAVQYSPDAGVSWETLVTNWPNNSYELAMNQISGTDVGLIRVLATDGFHTASDDSDSVFEVPDHPPISSILRPPNDVVYVTGHKTELHGYAYDAEDGVLDEMALEWSSDIDGFIGTGAVVPLDTNSLSLGVHTISLFAEDSSGNQSVAQVAVEIVPERPLLDASLVVAPANFDFTVSIDSDASMNQDTLVIRNNGDLEMSWTVVADQPWTSVAPSSGIDDEDVSIGIDPSWLEVGSHSGTLTVTAPGAANSPQVITVSVNVVPFTVDASAFPTTSIVPFESSFSCEVDGGLAPYTFDWDFGDGSPTSNLQNPNHTYSTAGEYMASVSVTDSMLVTRSPSSIFIGAELCVGNDASGDTDGDGICDDIDMCFGIDGSGDDDADGYCSDVDNCPTVGNPDQLDQDFDGIGNSCDNCIGVANADQSDQDGDGIGDACDPCTFPGDPGCVLFEDGFESGGVDNWSGAAGLSS